MKIKSFVQACKKLGLNPNRCLPGVSRMPKKHGAAVLAVAKLMIITEALNDGWEPDWDNSNEAKYFPWFWMNSPGFRLDGLVYFWSASYSGSGSRLCFRTQDLAEHAAKHFLKEYEALMCIPKKPAKKSVKK
jgi:hypothetical protein